MKSIRSWRRDMVKVIAGGATVTECFTKEISAEVYAEDTISAVDTVLRLIAAQA